MNETAHDRAVEGWPKGWHEEEPGPLVVAALDAVGRDSEGGDQDRLAWLQAFRRAVDDWRHARLDTPVTGVPDDAVEVVVAPWLTGVRHDIRALVWSGLELLSDTARQGLVDDLRSHLCELASAVMTLELETFRSLVRSPLVAWVGAPAEAERPPTVEQRFAAGLTGQGWGRLLVRHPVLARTLSVRTVLTCDAYAEMLARLRHDHATLANVFGRGRSLGPVRELQGLFSDSHHRGRVVVRLRFDAVTLFYKPRSLAAESAFGLLSEWLAERGFPIVVPAPMVLDCGTYGWMAAVPAQPCRYTADVASFYHRAGALMALAHALGGSDFHFDNLVAAGAHPCLIDLETLLGPRLRADSVPAARRGAGLQGTITLDESLLRTSMLPDWQSDEQAPAGRVDVGGVGTGQGIRGMALNRPVLEGASQDPCDWVAAITAGFRAGYHVLMAHRESLASTSGPLHALRQAPLRVVLRSTQVYAGIRGTAARAINMTSAASRSAAFRELAIAPGGEALAQARHAAVVRAETAALERGDLPHFVVHGDGTTLSTGGDGEIELDGQGTWARARHRLSGLGEEDLSRQLAIIETTYCLAREWAVEPRALSRRPVSNEVPASRTTLIDAARRIGGFLAGTAVREDDGPSWLTVEFDMSVRRYRVEPLGPGLYGGLVGVALFLTALGRTLRDPRMIELGRAATDSALRRLAEQRRRGLREEPGFASGVAGVLYGLSVLQRMDPRPGIRGAAVEMAHRLHPGSTPGLDLLDGAAGAALALLALYKATGDAALLRRASEWGQVVLDRRRRPPDGLPMRQGHVDADLLTGFAHGAAGIGHALASLFDATGAEVFREGALDAFADERPYFSLEHGNWADRRAGRDRHHDGAVVVDDFSMFGWCTGAPGSVLARLAHWSYLGHDEHTRVDVDRALASTRHSLWARGDDHVCCGRSGRALALLFAGRTLGRTDLIEEARQAGCAMIEAAHAHNGFALRAQSGPQIPCIGYWQGLSGIGYSLLQLAEPDDLRWAIAVE